MDDTWLCCGTVFATSLLVIDRWYWCGVWCFDCRYGWGGLTVMGFAGDHLVMRCFRGHVDDWHLVMGCGGIWDSYRCLTLVMGWYCLCGRMGYIGDWQWFWEWGGMWGWSSTRLTLDCVVIELRIHIQYRWLILNYVLLGLIGLIWVNDNSLGGMWGGLIHVWHSVMRVGKYEGHMGGWQCLRCCERGLSD